MERIPDDYQAPAPEQTVWTDGEYAVKGMGWVTQDDRQNPILKATKKGRMVSILHFKLADGKDGPPMSLELGEMGTFAKAMGVDVKTLPVVPTLDRPGKIAEYLRAVEDGVNNAEKAITVVVSGGWVNTVPGMDVLGYIYFVPDAFVSRDEVDDEPTFLPSQWGDGKYFVVRFEVVGGEGGGPSPFMGAKFVESLPYAFVVKEGSDGQITADWERTAKDGVSYTSGAVANARLMQPTAPDMFADDAIFENPANVLPQWWREASKKRIVLKGSRVRSTAAKSKGKPKLDWSSVEAAIGFNASAQAVINKPLPKPVEDVDIDDQARRLLRRLMTMMTSPADAFEGNMYNLTLAGKEIARTYLKSLKEQGLISVGFIGEMTYGDVAAALEKADWPLNVKDNVEALKKELLGIGVVSDADADF